MNRSLIRTVSHISWGVLLGAALCEKTTPTWVFIGFALVTCNMLYNSYRDY